MTGGCTVIPLNKPKEKAMPLNGLSLAYFTTEAES